jgi:BirA family transcriptional regulator, biotin operon repressor / biotin---[acetyl-CoA-carboxylase] ligase
MQIHDWENVLAGLPLGAVRFYERTTSTNDEAADWVNQNAPDLALVIADEQTAGRGRSGRSWFTPPGAALAFSLVLRLPEPAQMPSLIPRHTALGALAVCAAIQQEFSSPSEVKWPNDILVNRRKIGGVLAEADWLGQQLTALIIGIGVNVSPASIPSPEQLNYPATCLELECAQRVDRPILLRAILTHLLLWRSRIHEAAFIQAWEGALAFRGEWVTITTAGEAQYGELLGINQDGSLRLLARDGQIFSAYAGDVHLRPGGPASGEDIGITIPQ